MHSIEPMRTLHNDHLAASTASIDACMQRRYTISSTFQCMPTATHQIPGKLHTASKMSCTPCCTPCSLLSPHIMHCRFDVCICSA